MSKKLFGRAALAFGGSLFALATTGGIAQAQQPAAPASSATNEDEIVVTARGREERLQEVPLAITSFDEEALREAGVQNLRELSFLTPGVTVNSGGSEFGVNPVIRGLTNLNGGAGDSNVSVFLDGVYLQNLSAINLSLIDVERIEVVKGPVSALYGRNAYAGAINYVSKKPSNTFELGASATGGSDGFQVLHGSVGGPLISDVLAARVAVGYESYDGGYKDGVNGREAGGYEKKDAQASISFTPTQALSVYASAYYGDDVFQQSALAYNDGNCGVRTSATALVPNSFIQYCGRLEPDAHPVEVPALAGGAGISGNQREVFSTNLHVGLDLGFADVSYTGGYNKVTQQRLNDFLGLRNGITFALDPVVGNPQTTVNLLETFGSDGNNTDSSHELRLSSKQDQPFRWAVGGFYYDSELETTTIIGLDGRPIPPGRTLSSATGRQYLTADGRFAPGSFTQSRTEETQTSFFVGLDFDVTERLTLSGEARHTQQEKNTLLIRSTSCPATATGAATATCPASTPGTQPIYPFGGPGTATGNPSGTFDFDNYRGTIKYQASDDVMTYFSVANGTKGGGFNTRSTVPADLSFGPEENITYEAGIKTSLYNGTLQLNGAIFHIDTKDVQISGPSANAASTGLVVKNFGSTTSDGFEFEALASPMDGVRFNLGVGYSDAKFGGDAYDFGVAACQSIPSCAPNVVTIQAAAGPRLAVSLKDFHVPRSSSLQVNGGIALNGSLVDDWGWFARADYRYESKQYSLPNNFNYFGPRNVVNLRGGVENDHVRLEAFVDNATDDHTPETASYNVRLNDFNAYYTMYLPTPRLYGVTVSYKY